MQSGLQQPFRWMKHNVHKQRRTACEKSCMIQHFNAVLPPTDTVEQHAES